MELSLSDAGSTLERLEWDNVAHSEWWYLKSRHKLFKPFAQYTALISGEEYTTLSSVLPILMELQLHLRDMALISEITVVATILLSELNRHFKKYTDPDDEVY